MYLEVGETGYLNGFMAPQLWVRVPALLRKIGMAEWLKALD